MSTRRPPNENDDRRSAVSSFYGGGGGRQSPMNALDAANHQQYSPVADTRERRDSASTFFGRNVEEYATSQSGSFPNPGYSSESYRPQGGRVEPVKGLNDDAEAGGGGGGWNVFADFNNTGPRYSTAFGSTNSNGYRPLETPNTPGSKVEHDGPVELVTVPAFGPEWKAEELRDMSKAGRAAAKAEERTRKWKEWSRDQRGVCGSKWGTRRVMVWTLFALIVIVGIALVFLIPRVPGFAFNGDSPFKYGGGDFNFVRAPAANFTFNAKIDLQADTHASFIPVHFTNIYAEVYDIDSLEKVATGNLGSYTVGAKDYVPLELPVTFSYSAPNATDPTWLRFYNACRSKAQYTDGKRPGLKLRLILSISIRGLVGKSGSSTTIDDAACPIELPTNSA